eukprot:m.1633674 g.1633674  ORF g.1633674 m.1633674 type:complete len:298 (-) comp25410_c0_seq1:1334-2227(-)
MSRYARLWASARNGVSSVMQRCEQRTQFLKPSTGRLTCLAPHKQMSTFPQPKRNATSPVTWATLGVFLAVGGGAAFYVHLEREKRSQVVEKRKAKTAGAPAIGGPFTLVDVNGNSFSNSDLFGKWVVLYFGFTFCPDICPEELDKLTEVIDILDKTPDMPEVTPVFISVDPNRDTPEKLKEYLLDFHPRMIGLTGPEADIKKTAKAYRVYYSRPEENSDGDDYLVDHTIIMYLLDPEGNFCQYYGQIYTAEDMATGMVKFIRERTKSATAIETSSAGGSGLLDFFSQAWENLVSPSK